MNQKEKDLFLSSASKALQTIIERVKSNVKKTKEGNKKLREELPKANEDNKIVQQSLLTYGVKREGELEALEPSPYFVRCLVDLKGEVEELYFGKFSCIDEGIYSWVTPASSIRFEKPGKISYTRPSGDRQEGVLLQKDQYMIVEGKIVFLSTESTSRERELVYQEYFSKQKIGFILPEVVAQMEKAQDLVIRANHRGPLLISGPAGSGKTTLALHRVAYLAQSPDVSDQFLPSSIIVFVQDEGTRDYFSHLLPELGIKGVTITTFANWAMQALDIKNHEYIFRFGNTEKERDMYEYKKRQALKNFRAEIDNKDIYKTLETAYSKDFTNQEKELFIKQQKERKLDRFDLTILLVAYKKKHGTLTLMQEYYQMAKSGAAKKKVGRFPVNYSLMIFDEFQNYLPEQIKLAKGAIDEKNNAVMYVGDMAQQTQLGTIHSWEEAGERVKEERSVVLQKVYRNTKNILKYIQSIGYNVDIVETLKEGAPVVEKVVDSKQQEIAYLHSITKDYTGSIGILAKDKSYLESFEEISTANKQIHLMSMNEAQGVEFDLVCIVGISKEFFSVEYGEEHKDLIEEKKRMNKDLLYVALTRAIKELHIVGTCSLKEAVSL